MCDIRSLDFSATLHPLFDSNAIVLPIRIPMLSYSDAPGIRRTSSGLSTLKAYDSFSKS